MGEQRPGEQPMGEQPMGEQQKVEHLPQRPALLTVGHGRLDREALGDLLAGAGVERLVDVRRFPGSRANPGAARGVVPQVAQERGIAYRWEERLGGRRSLTAAQRAQSPDTWWRVEAFGAYAAWTRSEDFRAALPELLADIAEGQTAILCSESVWWRCHRRLVSDVVSVEFDTPVRHLMPDGRLADHVVSAGARVGDDGRLVWDGPA